MTPGAGSYFETVQTNHSSRSTQNGTRCPNEPVPTNTSQSAQNETRSLNNTSQSTPRNNANNSKNKNMLLIVDSLLSGVNGKGTKNFVHSRSVPGATIDRIRENTSMYDLSQFIKDIIIYCDGYDAAKSDSPNSFKKEFERLLQHIRSKNSDYELFLCGSSPRGDVDVIGINTVIKQLLKARVTSL